MHSAQYWIDKLRLMPHPEGGYYKEVYRSQSQVNRLGGTAAKAACTSIYYLLEGEDFSGFHRLASDEIWYFHKGGPLLIHGIGKEGRYSKYELSDLESGNLSVVIEPGLWFAAEVPSKQDYTLVSCAVAPGFDFAGFEMAKKNELVALYPQHGEVISRLCR